LDRNNYWWKGWSINWSGRALSDRHVLWTDLDRHRRPRSSKPPRPFARTFCASTAFPMASYRNFTTAAAAVAYVRSLRIDQTGHRQVVKASGLAAGKGVLLPTNEAETVETQSHSRTDHVIVVYIKFFTTAPEGLERRHTVNITIKGGIDKLTSVELPQPQSSV
jgi:hypothetical protein